MTKAPTHLVTVTPYGRRGGSSRVRVFDWIDHLKLAVTSYDYAGLSTNTPRVLARHPGSIVCAEASLRTLASNARNSTLLLSKQASPISTGHLEEMLLSRAKRGIYDFDDSLRDEVPRNRAYGMFAKPRIWERSVRAADVVIAGNAYLADQAASLVGEDRVVVIPSCVEPDTYRDKVDYSISGAPIAVWLGSPSTEGHICLIEAPLLALHRSHGLRLRLISAGKRPLGALDKMTDRVEWSPDANNQLADADIGLMPLEDSPRARGKCAYKLLQYGAASLPAVASPVGANETAIHLGVGIAASTPDEWAHNLCALIEAPESDRAAAGRRARSAVGEFYSFAAWARVWRSVVF